MTRTRARRMAFLPLLVIVAALLLAACGGDDAGTATPAPAPATPTDPNAAPGTTVGDPCAADPASAECLAASGDVAGGGELALPDLEGGDLEGGLDVLGGGDLFQADVIVGDDANQEPERELDLGGSSGSSSFDFDLDDEFDDGFQDDFSDPEPVAPSYTGAKIWINSKTYEVGLNKTFPDNTQLFRLTDVTSTTMTIELVAGELSGGSTGITFTKGDSRTLLNQNEGTTYEIRYDGAITASLDSATAF